MESEITIKHFKAINAYNNYGCVKFTMRFFHVAALVALFGVALSALIMSSSILGMRAKIDRASNELINTRVSNVYTSNDVDKFISLVNEKTIIVWQTLVAGAIMAIFAIFASLIYCCTDCKIDEYDAILKSYKKENHDTKV